MKFLYSLVFLFVFLPVFSQQEQVDKKISKILTHIDRVPASEKLILMDSVSSLIAYETDFSRDSLVFATFELAKSQNAADIAIKQGANLIFLYSNLQASPQKGQNLYLQANYLLPKVKDKRLLAKWYYESGNAFFYGNEFLEALKLFDSAYKYAQKFDNEKFMGLALQARGQVKTDMGDFGRASQNLQKAIAIFEKLQDTNNLVDTRNTLSILYSKIGFFEEAEKERMEVLVMEKERKLFDLIPILHYNSAADYHKLGLEPQRIKELKNALEYVKYSKNSAVFEPIMIAALVAAYAENGKIKKGDSLLKAMNAAMGANPPEFYRPYYLKATKKLAFSKGHFQQAEKLGLEYLDLKKKGKQFEELQEAEYFLYEVYNNKEQDEFALRHLENYLVIKDSIDTSNNVRLLAYYQTLYETEKRDHTILAQTADIKLLTEKNKVKTQWLLFGGLGIISAFGFLWILRSRNFLKKKQILQAKFTQEVLQVQESERARIATELHDNIGQKLLVIKNFLFSQNEKEQQELELISEAIEEVRSLSHNLHPFQFQKLGLKKSLINLVETFQKSSDIFYSEDLRFEDTDILKEKGIFIFRMIQEALTNVEKHSEATACNLSSVVVEETVVFTIKDNGKGFEYSDSFDASEGLGLQTLAERAHFIGAQLTLMSNPKKGTIITLKISEN